MLRNILKIIFFIVFVILLLSVVDLVGSGGFFNLIDPLNNFDEISSIENSGSLKDNNDYYNNVFQIGAIFFIIGILIYFVSLNVLKNLRYLKIGIILSFIILIISLWQLALFNVLFSLMGSIIVLLLIINIIKKNI